MICPVMSGPDNGEVTAVQCIGSRCALWVNLPWTRRNAKGWIEGYGCCGLGGQRHADPARQADPDGGEPPEHEA